MPVFHLDIDTFLTSLHRVHDPALRRRPLVIAPRQPRAVVLAASADAKQLGICRNMPLAVIHRHFKGTAIVPPNYRLYDTANHAVLDIVHRFSPVVEPIGYGHIAMDMTGMRRLFTSLENAALRLCRQISEQICLDATVGIATNKLVSTIAAKEVQKNNELLFEVEQDREAGFLAPLSCKVLPESDGRTVKRLLFELNLRRISQIQAIPRDIFSFALGKVGTQLHRHAQGIDPQPVTPLNRLPRLDEQHRFVPDTNDDAVIRATIFNLVEKLCSQLRAKGVTSSAAGLRLCYSDEVVRQRRFRFIPTKQEEPVFQALMRDYYRICDRRRRVRMVGLYLEGLCASEAQPTLFEQEKPIRIAPGLDAVRARFGEKAIGYGRVLKAG